MFRVFCYMLLHFSIHQMALGLFWMMASLARDMIIASTFGSAVLLVIFSLGGFILPKALIKPRWAWAFWLSPLSYGQRAISVSEFTATRWMKRSALGNTTVGYNVLNLHDLPNGGYWYWLGIGVLLLYAVFLNIMVTLALGYLKPIKKSQTVIPHSVMEDNSAVDGGINQVSDLSPVTVKDGPKQRGMILPFQP